MPPDSLVVLLPAHWHLSTSFITGLFLLSISFFVFSFIPLLFFIGSVQQIKLAKRHLLGARKYSASYRIVSCRIVSYSSVNSRSVSVNFLKKKSSFCACGRTMNGNELSNI